MHWWLMFVFLYNRINIPQLPSFSFIRVLQDGMFSGLFWFIQEKNASKEIPQIIAEVQVNLKPHLPSVVLFCSHFVPFKNSQYIIVSSWVFSCFCSFVVYQFNEEGFSPILQKYGHYEPQESCLTVNHAITEPQCATV